MLATVEASYGEKSTLINNADFLLNPLKTHNLMHHKPSMASLGQSSTLKTAQTVPNQMNRSPSSTSMW
jgi:hypothetical protein